MPIDLPSSALELEERSKTDVLRALPGSNPFLKNSALGALVTSNSNRVFDFYEQLAVLQNLLMPDTAVDEFLERWTAIYGITRLAATRSSGNIIVGGTPGATIPAGTLFVSSDNQIYQSTALAEIQSESISVASISRSGTVATVVTTMPHNLATNITPTIAGALEPEYNAVNLSIINVVDETTFTYEVQGDPSTPATGTILLSYDGALTPVESQDFQNSEEGTNVNLPNGAQLNIQSPIVGVGNTAGVGAIPISGGSDQESDASLSARLARRNQRPVANFNVAAITQKAQEVAGVTRVFVQEVTPAVGQITVYFMRDNDDNPIPDSNEIEAVKNSILEIKPANTSSDDVIVDAPVPVVTNFEFSFLTPNTPSLQSAVANNLQQFFSENTEVGVDVQRDSYRAAIQNTIDVETGDTVQDFDLISPTSNIPVSSGEIATLGEVTIP